MVLSLFGLSIVANLPSSSHMHPSVHASSCMQETSRQCTDESQLLVQLSHRLIQALQGITELKKKTESLSQAASVFTPSGSRGS